MQSKLTIVRSAHFGITWKILIMVPINILRELSNIYNFFCIQYPAGVRDNTI